MKNLQKTKRLSKELMVSLEEGKAPKKRKVSKDHQWSIRPDVPEGETMDSLKKYREELVKDVKKKPKDVKLNKDFMEQTYPLRRHEILDNPCPVKDILLRYPSLCQFVHVSLPDLHVHVLYHVCMYYIVYTIGRSYCIWLTESNGV